MIFQKLLQKLKKALMIIFMCHGYKKKQPHASMQTLKYKLKDQFYLQELQGSINTIFHLYSFYSVQTWLNITFNK